MAWYSNGPLAPSFGAAACAQKTPFPLAILSLSFLMKNK